MRDPERSELMAMAFSYQQGKTQGEFDREFNPEYQRQLKEAAEKLRKARG